MKKTLTALLLMTLLLFTAQTVNVFACTDYWSLLQKTIRETTLPLGEVYSQVTISEYIDARNYAISLDETATDYELKNASEALGTAFLNLKPANVYKKTLWKAIEKLQNKIYIQNSGYKFKDVEEVLLKGKNTYYFSNSQETINEVTKEIEQFVKTLPKKNNLLVGDSKKCRVIHGEVKQWKSSDKKVAIIKDNKVIALTKGTVTITANMKSGDKLTTELTVNKEPMLTVNGKKVNSVMVKKGKTITLKIKGKADKLNNSYENTKIAKVISKKSAKAIKILGLIRGNTTLKITVNGKKLAINVRVN